MVSLGRAFHFSLSRLLAFPLSRLLTVWLGMALLGSASTQAADSYFGAKPIVTTLHPTTNYLVAVLGHGSNAVVRIINPEELLTLMKSLTNWNAQTASQVLSNLAANAGTTATNAAATQFVIANGTLWAIPGIALTNLAVRSSAIDKVALTLAGAAGQDSNLLEVNDSLGNRLWGIGYDGTMIGAPGESPRLASSSTVGHVWTATDTIGNGSFQALTGGGSVNSVGILSGDLTTNGSPVTSSGTVTMNLRTNAIIDRTEDQAPATNDPIATVDVSAAALKRVVLGNLPISGPAQTALDAKQGLAAILTALAGLGSTNQLVFTNDVWLLRMGSNGVVVAQGTGIGVSSSGSAGQQTFTVSITDPELLEWSGISTNKIVTTNDVWLLRRGSNGVVVASGTGLGVSSSGSSGQQTFTVSITDAELLEWSGISTNLFLTTNHVAFLDGLSNKVRVASGDSISVSASGSGGVMTYTPNSTALVTNVTSLSNSNATSKPILHGIVNRTANLMGAEAGANMTITPNGSNLVFAASAGAASTNNPVDASGFVVPTNGIIQLQLPLVQGGTNLWAHPGSASYGASWSNNIAANAGGLTNVMLSNMVVGVTVDIWLTITPGVTVQFPQFSSSQWISGIIPRFATNSSTVHVQAINRGGGITNLWVVQNELVLIKGSRVTFTTNFATGEVTMDVDSTLAAIGSAPVTNELSSQLQINSGILSLSAGVLSNLVQSLVDFPAANIVSNVSAIAFGTAWQKVAPTNSVTVTNLTGLVHASSASVIVIDANQSHEWTITNRVTAATTLVFTNGADGQTINVNLLGEVSGGTSRVISLVPHTGTLIADEDDFSVALATSASFTLTNGNGAEISWRIRRLNGTNTAGKLTRQFKF